jgi:hypothetical protein
MPAEPKEWAKLFKEMAEDADDRTAVILGGSFVEAALERMLLTWLVPEKDVEEFFNPLAKAGFLSTFGAKKNLAYALGLLEDEDEKKQLQAIATIRNVFAHQLLDATFQHPDVVKPLKTLRTLVEAKYVGWTPKPPDRLVFVTAVRMVAMSFNMRSLDPKTTKAFRRQVQDRVKRQWVAAGRRVKRSVQP